jgi:hypothetical protein
MLIIIVDRFNLQKESGKRTEALLNKQIFVHVGIFKFRIKIAKFSL